MFVRPTEKPPDLAFGLTLFAKTDVTHRSNVVPMLLRSNVVPMLLRSNVVPM